MILNDGIHTIAEHPEEFVTNLIRAQRELLVMPKDAPLRGNVPCYNHGNVAHIIASEHADFTQIVGVGGNYGKLFDIALTGGHMSSKEDEVEIIKVWAEKLGYHLTKKSTSKI